MHGATAVGTTCALAGDPAGLVHSHGFRERDGVVHRRYRCATAGGKRHIFDVPLDDEGEPRQRSWSSPSGVSEAPDEPRRAQRDLRRPDAAAAAALPLLPAGGR